MFGQRFSFIDKSLEMFHSTTWIVGQIHKIKFFKPVKLAFYLNIYIIDN